MDGAWGIHWLIDYLNEDSDTIGFLLSLTEKLEKQGYDWKEHFDNFFYIHFIKATQEYNGKIYPMVFYGRTRKERI